MKEMGWSWADLYEAPPEIVQEIIFMITERTEE